MQIIFIINILNNLKGVITMKKEIFAIIITGKKWFDKNYGNTHHSSNITVIYNDKSIKNFYNPFQYGYGDQYLYTSFQLLEKEKVLNLNGEFYWRYCRDNNIILNYSCAENCRKKDL